MTGAGACLVLAALAVPGPATAQVAAGASDTWRIGASAGGFVPRSAMIVAAEGRDTRLGPGPSFSLELQYLGLPFVAPYASGSAAFSSVALGADIRPAATGPSEQATVIGVTGGLFLTPLPGETLQPTLRVGGGIKGYSFGMDGADSQWRPTGDFGLGFRGMGAGGIEVSAEVRYLPSTIDQSRLPTRGIAPQDQRQTDLIFAVGIGVRL
jgi:hypothetical protein